MDWREGCVCVTFTTGHHIWSFWNNLLLKTKAISWFVLMLKEIRHSSFLIRSLLTRTDCGPAESWHISSGRLSLQVSRHSLLNQHKHFSQDCKFWQGRRWTTSPTCSPASPLSLPKPKAPTTSPSIQAQSAKATLEWEEGTRQCIWTPPASTEVWSCPCTSSCIRLGSCTSTIGHWCWQGLGLSKCLSKLGQIRAPEIHW